MKLSPAWLVGGLLSLLASAAAQAGDPGDCTDCRDRSEAEPEEEPDEIVVVRGSREPVEAPAVGCAEVVEVAGEARRLATVEEVLSRAVGVQVRRLGGLGSFGLASIRGSSAAQVPVYLDGLLLNAGGLSAVDLGELSLDILGTLVVHRGQTPVRLPTAGLGGAIELRTRAVQGTSAELALTAGSFDTLRLFGLVSGAWPGLRALALGSLTSSSGDFEYLNRNGTLFESADDRVERRANNAHRGGEVLLKLDAQPGAWRLTLLESLHARRQGVPGIDSLPTHAARLTSARNALGLRGLRPVGEELLVGLEASHLLLTSDFDDTRPPHGEIGLGRQRTRSTTQAVDLGAHGLWTPAPGHATSARLDARWEQLEGRELLSGAEFSPKTRWRAQLGLEHEWRPLNDLRLVPSARLGLLRATWRGGPLAPGLGTASPASTTEPDWQAALGARWELGGGVALRANAGRYVRLPDLTELFGDQGSMVGNPSLVPERGVNADLGAAWGYRGDGLVRAARLELDVFGTWADELIALVQNSQASLRPENLDGADILGLEASLRLELWDHLDLAANYTYLFARSRSAAPYLDGKRLPGRPAHEAYLRLEGRVAEPRWGAALWAELDYAGLNALDAANLKEDALARLLVSAGLRLTRPREGLSLTLEVQNLLDTISLRDADGRLRPLRDFESFPLPGRSVLATLHVRLGGGEEGVP
ncbi:MAG TPA: TonB-dependent receptor [Myxococcota bacterium]|nr:TonB-dependent receptor [Myxococcota bacterium]HRY97293.1 TonB-dependent receptor [Myxococcota bacterium]